MKHNFFYSIALPTVTILSFATSYDAKTGAFLETFVSQGLTGHSDLVFIVPVPGPSFTLGILAFCILGATS